MQQTSQINWLSILRGMTIMLVVAYHTHIINAATGKDYQYILDTGVFFSPLRMPTFVMISGALLYHTRIKKEIQVIDLYKDKLIRLALPLFFCTCIANIIQIAFSDILRNSNTVTLSSFLLSFVEYDHSPWVHRWYLMVLMLLMSIYPLYRYVLKSDIMICITLICLLCLWSVDFTQYVETNWLKLFSINKYLPFFFLGIVIFKYELWHYMAKWYYSIFFWIVYVIIYSCGYGNMIIESLIGILAMMTTAIQMDKVVPTIFSSFRKYIFQIYLFGMVIQGFIDNVIWTKIGQPDNLSFCFYVFTILCAVYIPVIISKLVEKIPVNYIRLSFGLK